ncbi:GGDEF domain-containing protein [Aurantiacibacter flavus]|uniref:diguanylate cyclase n=1 Tax=Aurantiacibacter flavus TaxID=3145232 RepID=A0ABV0D057_9SPHN
MPQAILPILTNMLVAVMFIGAFLVTAHTYPMVRRARWFALAYAFGVLDPLANLGIWLGGNVRVMQTIGFAGFLTALVTMALALSYYHRRPPMWACGAAILVCGCIWRIATIDAPRDTIWYQLSFQSWFAMGSVLCAVALSQHAPRSLLNRCLVSVYIVTALHFLVKAAFATALGTGATERDFAGTIYAVISQTSSGLLMIAAGLLVVASFLHSVVRATQTEALSDPLTGLPNRRAFDQWLDVAQGDGMQFPLSVAIIDVDHFKRFNDRFGHAVGDEVLREVAACLERNRPSAGRAARVGGEEFVLLLPMDRRATFLVVESMRMAIAQLAYKDTDPITVSIGIATMERGESTSELLRRADRALYRAKAAGRDRCEIDTPDEESASPVARPALKLVARH